MANSASIPGTLPTIGDVRWLRGHVSTFFVGIVLLILINLGVGNSTLWSVTATGIWLILLVVHGIVVIIDRLSAELVAEDIGEGGVVLPVQDAIIVDRAPDMSATWVDANTPPTSATPSESETVSWQIATDTAQHRRTDEDDAL